MPESWGLLIFAPAALLLLVVVVGLAGHIARELRAMIGLDGERED